MIASTVAPILDIVTDLGESPTWSVREQALYWIDVTQRLVHRHHPATGTTRTCKVTGIPGSLALRAQGGLAIVLRAGLVLLDFETGAETSVSCGLDFSRERFNDCASDRRGRLFAGTMDKDRQEALGKLYRIDPDHRMSVVTDGLLLSNGLVFSPDDRQLYHCDSRPGRVYVHDYDIETGIPTNRRVLIDYAGTGYHPDGCTVDAEGHLWVAEVGHGTVGRFAPDGTRMGEIRLPVSRVTSVMFGGADLRTLYCTSMRYNVPADLLAREPEAGRLFMCRPGVAGLPEPAFAG